MEDRIFAITVIPGRIKNREGGIEYRGELENAYELYNRTLYDHMGNILEEAPQGMYDTDFVNKMLDFEPPYMIPDLLEFHLDRTRDKIKYLHHLKYVILNHDWLRLPENVKEMIGGWIESKLYNNTKLSSTFAYGLVLKFLHDKGIENFIHTTGSIKKSYVKDFIDSQKFINPKSGKVHDSHKIYLEFTKIMEGNCDFEYYSEERPDEYDFAKRFVSKYSQ